MIYTGPVLGVIGLVLAVHSGNAVAIGVCAGLLVATLTFAFFSTRPL